MNLYDKNGYLNFDRIASLPVNFIFIYGGRGSGKTFGALKYVKEHGIKFIFTRRQIQEYDIVSQTETSPFKKLNDKYDWHVEVKKITKNVSGFYDDGQGSPIGYMTALAAVAHIRGMDFSDCDWWIYDEFIPEPHVRPMKEEGQAVLNAYETFCRNRELEGGRPMKLIALANANQLANPVFMELDLVTTAERMKRTGQNFWINNERGVALIDPFDSPVSEEKEETALYKLVNKNSEFYKMSIENKFRDLEEASPKSKSLKEYVPVVRIGEITLYKHKSRREYYCSTHHMGVCPEYRNSEIDRQRCLNRFEWIPEKYLSNHIEFESYLCEALFNKYLFT